MPLTMTGLVEKIEGARTGSVVAAATGVLAVIAALDYLTGAEFAFSYFYILPISAVVWKTDRRGAVVASVVAALTWLAMEIAGRPASRSPLLSTWNGLVRLAFFLTVSLLLASLHAALKRQSVLALTDPLTGLPNRRAFEANLRREQAHFERTGEPFVLALIDLDDFKAINEAAGHDGGDRALVAVAEAIGGQVRRTDVVARLGGDEFGVILSGADGRQGRVLRRIVDAVGNRRIAGRSLSCSIGAAQAAGTDLAVTMKQADDALFEAKGNGKGHVRVAGPAGAFAGD